MPTVLKPLSPTKLFAIFGGVALRQIDVADHKARPIAAAVKTHHILLIDCSGSMAGQLPLIRKDAKNRMTNSVKEGDLVSIGYFSSTGQYGFLLETVAVRDLADHSKVYQAIDRLQPMGLTAFVGPLKKVSELVEEAQQRHPEHAHTLFFLTDGHDNQARSEDEILTPCRRLSQQLAKSVVVESGYYCNRQLLLRMTEALGGTHIFAEDFPAYQHALEQSFTSTVSATKKLVRVNPETIHLPFVFAIEDGQVVTFATDDAGEAQIPEHLQAVYALTRYERSECLQFPPRGLQPELLATLLLLSQRVQTELAVEVLRHLGDVALIKQFANAFGKQALSDFQARVSEHLAGRPLYADGYDPNAMPADDAFCLLDLLDILARDPDAKWYPKDSAFKYRRISAGSGFGFTEAEKQTLAQHMDALVQATDEREVATLQAALNTLITQRLPLTVTYLNANPGMAISRQKWNENRPNLLQSASYRVAVTLPADLAQALGQPTIETWIHKDYAIVQDGIVNVKTLPVSMSQATYDLLVSKGADILMPWVEGHIYNVDLAGLPVINRKRAGKVSAVDMAQRTWELQLAKAHLKAVDALLVERGHAGTSKGLVGAYGEELAGRLKGLGFSDSSFNAKTVTVKSGEEYVAKQLSVKFLFAKKPIDFKLPSANELAKKLTTGKALNPPEQMLADALDEVRADVAKYANSPESEVTFLEKAKEVAERRERQAAAGLSQMKMALVLSQGWFTEFASLEDNELTVELGGEDRQLTFASEDVTVKI